MEETTYRVISILFILEIDWKQSLFSSKTVGGGGECKTSKGHARTLSFLRCFPRIFEEKRDSSQSLLEMVLTTTWLQCIY